MDQRIIADFLRCPACSHERLDVDAFEQHGPDIRNAVVVCERCRTWYRLEDGLLELLVPALRLPAVDAAFRARVIRECGAWSHDDGAAHGSVPDAHKLGQKTFYDSDADSYEAGLMQLTFWRSFDRAYTRTIGEFAGPAAVMLEVGGGSGRQSIPLRDTFAQILSFDISEAMVRQAMRRLAALPDGRRNIHYFVADAENIPVRSGCADAAIFSGILHHVASPGQVLRETARALRDGGRFVGMENNRTVLRPLFDLLMSVSRLWNEKAHPEHFIIGARELRRWFADAGLVGSIWTSVFLPPHLFNAVPSAAGDWMLRASDRIGRAIPWLRNQGGLVLFTGEKPVSPGAEFAGAQQAR